MEGCNDHLKQQAEMQNGGQGPNGSVRSQGSIDESGDSGGFADGVPVTGDIAGFGGIKIEKDY